jgi:hypothetical protein
MATKGNKKEKITTIAINQNFTIDTIAQINRDFQNCINKNESVVIKSDVIENIDLTGIQFLMYSKKFASTTNCKVTFAINFSDTTQDLIRKTGFSSILD